jgi:hypothetical protein
MILSFFVSDQIFQKVSRITSRNHFHWPSPKSVQTRWR